MRRTHSGLTAKCSTFGGGERGAESGGGEREGERTYREDENARTYREVQNVLRGERTQRGEGGG